MESVDFDFTETPTAPTFNLRDYQVACIDAVRAGWEKYSRQLIDAATGTGKTTMFAAIAAEEWSRGNRTLVLENRDALVWQTAQRITKETGIEADVEKAENIASPDAPIVVASVQTLSREARLTGFADDHFGLVITDECFPGDTLIDGKPIKNYSVGDYVRSFNHACGAIEKRRVTHVFKNSVKALVRVRMGDGSELICTPEHPIFSAARGYVPASSLTSKDMVVSVTDYAEAPQKPDHGDVRRMLVPISDVLLRTKSLHQKGDAGLLLGRMPKAVLRSRQFSGDGSDQSEVCVSANAFRQPDEKRRGSRKGQHNASSKRVGSDCARWERTRGDGASAIAGIGIGLGDGSRGSDIEASWLRLPELLQTRRGKCRAENRHRSGWIQSQHSFPQSAGREERGIFTLVRVDSVEVYQPRSRGGFAEVCPDGFVFNLEVEGNNNYFAGGFLVHNCHHSLARSYNKVLGYFHYGAESLVDGFEPPAPEVAYPYKARILGVTATPDLGNRRSLGEFYQHIAYQYQLLQAVADGWLVRPITKNIPLKIDIRGLRPGRTPNGSDFTAMELSERLVPVLESLADQIAAMAGDRKSIAFVPSIECARVLAAACCRKGLKGIFVSGECIDVDEKTEDFRRSGPGTVLCNAALYVEGADFPDINCVVCARATKSKGFYRQQVGRGTRVLPGVVDGLPTPDLRKLAIARSAKPDLLVLDPLWVSDRIDLCDAYDLFTEKPEVKAQLKADGDPTAEKALEAERDFIKALEKEARKHARKQARTIDPLAHAVALGDAALASWMPETSADMRPPTMGQLDFLRRHGVSTENIKHAGFAHKLIGRVLSRIKLGLATPKQLSLMSQLGLSETYCATLTIPEASAAIDAALSQRKRQT